MSNISPTWINTHKVITRVKEQIAEEDDWVSLLVAIDYFGFGDSEEATVDQWEEAIRRLLSTGELFLRCTIPRPPIGPLEENPVPDTVTPREIAEHIATSPDLYLMAYMLDSTDNTDPCSPARKK
ncbi:hypothetical protein L1O03_00495 [Corynebacterium uropygiale]|uniref:Uncharacterized protein n=1 Tax=Corynebacterium uropygiale TaxID=1775911 RepID=A0A9X1QLX3_9CORY|nr:hypothetical protein [Corynebacterium uropygiale]MCF4005664.1 hypothetical protein [Corynebacterium uropygiale]